MKESSDGETLMAVGTWFQIWGAAEENVVEFRERTLYVRVATLKYSLTDWEPVEMKLRYVPVSRVLL